MFWVGAVGWGIALLVGVVVLGFCAYEISWKAARLTKDLDSLKAVQTELVTLQARLAEMQPRIARATNN